jgi:hypothetical protein
MTDIQDSVASILEQVEHVERAARRRAMLLTLLPIIFAAILLGVTFWQVRSAQDRLTEINQKREDAEQALLAVSQRYTDTQAKWVETSAEVISLTQKLNSTSNELKRLQSQLEISRTLLISTGEELSRSTKILNEIKTLIPDVENQLNQLQDSLVMAKALQEYPFPNGWEVTLKELESRYVQQHQENLFQMLSLIFMAMNDGSFTWNPGGASLTEGFNSPAFAAYVLSEVKVLPVSAEYFRTVDLLQGALKSRSIKDPHLGDVIFYRAGYSLFYFEDELGQPFVIGMTPRGIMALNYKFSEPIGIGAVNP